MLNIKKGANMKVLQGLTSTIHSLTGIVIALLGLGIVLALLGGDVPFLGDVAGNIINLVDQLGSAGVVGLIAAIVILNFYK